MKYQIPKGLFDILPNAKESFKEVNRWQYLESIINKLAIDYNFEEIRVPIFEKTELFLRGVGATSDIASKELYTFLDKAKRSMSLRPEGTASVMRAFIENNLSQEKKFHKLYYMGPMFRYDRPQKGRYRQHHQLGVEIIGDKSFEIDAEVIDMLVTLFKRLELKNLKLLINSIGDLETRTNYKKALLDFLKPNFENLSEESKARFDKNPMRILDSKDERDKKILKEAPSILDFLSDAAKKHFENLLNLLDKLDIKYEVDSKLVRGLDYYDDTVFEVVSEKLGGAQNSLGGGGRYNSLLKSLGGPDLPGIGFACGLERILQTMIEEEVYFPEKEGPFLYIIPIGEDAKDFAILLAKDLRHHKISVDIDLNAKKIQKSLSLADKLNAKNALILADDEMQKKVASFKNLDKREQQEIKFEDLKNFIRDKFYKL
ncbi:MAG: Histidine--tRNA ligase [Candidatus Anoxychlamydiales bacterium]|nr:Histidine--tRNA ligase [Candidatus Anoxychlamydiales bacterium]